MGTVYIITNTENEKVYIGSTVQSLNKRFIQHKSRAIKGVKRYLVYDEMRKIGIDKFSIHPLIENIPKEKLYDTEIETINKYTPKNNLLNTSYGVPIADIEYIIQSYKNGKRLKVLAKEMGHCSKTVSKILKENNVDIFDWNEYQKIACMDKELEKLYVEKFMTTVEISKLYNTSPQTVRKHLISLNIPLRKAVKRKYLKIMPTQSEMIE